ncbi:hypothetical protein D3C72_2564900 [compost metagenome]
MDEADTEDGVVEAEPDIGNRQRQGQNGEREGSGEQNQKPVAVLAAEIVARQSITGRCAERDR